ncbi:MAG: carbon storage regulator [Pirellulales bacterium]|nr:carbon storage regulator [Pirellulales bacterium]
MLVLSRKINEEIVIGDNIRVRLVKVGGGRARLGITAPADVSVRRAELPKKEGIHGYDSAVLDGREHVVPAGR